MDSDSLDRAWDPAAPGAGALRATAIAQLYFRMTSHHPLTVLVVDALCLTFGADGVSVQELVDYLGISEDRLRFGLDAIPAEMRCTSQQLAAEGGGATGASGAAMDTSATLRREGAAEVRHFLNYKRLLPLVYAHVTRLLLACCVVDVPPCSYVASVKATHLASYRHSVESTAHAFFAGTQAASASTARPHVTSTTSASSSAAAAAEDAGEHIDVSDVMRRKGALSGVYCLGCSCYFAVEEFNATLSRCPRCGRDSLRLCLQSLQRHLTAKAAQQHTLVKLLPSVSQVWKRNLPALLQRTQGQQQQQQQPERHTAESSSGVSGAGPHAPPHSTPATAGGSAPQLRCALARDPFLFQQALAFLFLYSTTFASVNDAASVVDAQHILTEPEYRERLRGKASLADQFRSRHRHASSIHVRVVSQADVDAARRAESHRKLLKRAMLPPWLRHTSALEALGGSHAYHGHGGEKAATAEPAQEPWESERASGATETATVAPSVHSGAVWKQEGSTSPPVSAEKRPRSTAAAVTKAALTRAADFVAQNFYEDEYDEVALPLSRPRWE